METVLTSPGTLPTAAKSRALILFAKYPQPGRAKTRLSPPLTQTEAAAFYACMLHDSIAMARSLQVITPLIFFQDDPGAAGYFKTLAPQILSLPQEGENLGERLKNAFAGAFKRGFAEVAIIGTDSPDLPSEYIFEAFALLEDEQTDVVFGPAEDGGYYLLGMKRVWEELFRGLPWSSGELLAASIEKAKELRLGVSLLPLWHDIDTEADLKRKTLLDKKSPARISRNFLISELQPDNRLLADR